MTREEKRYTLTGLVIAVISLIAQVLALPQVQNLISGAIPPWLLRLIALSGLGRFYLVLKCLINASLPASSTK